MPTAEAARYRSPPPYVDRASKSRYIAEKYAPILATSVLDIGCDQKLLSTHLPRGVRYVGLDIAPPADLTLNLDTPGATLPFADQAFDTVVCCDVLEHLERIHAVFDELCRVASGHLVISLPNPLRNLIDAIHAGRGATPKFYGLPVDPPADRHRWFFGADEAAHFLTTRAARCDFEVEQLDHDTFGCPRWISNGINLLESTNITRGTTWCVLKRR